MKNKLKTLAILAGTLIFAACTTTSAREKNIRPTETVPALKQIAWAERVSLFEGKSEPALDISIEIVLLNTEGKTAADAWLNQIFIEKTLGEKYATSVPEIALERFVREEIASYKKECGLLAQEPDVSTGTLSNTIYIKARIARDAGTRLIYEIDRTEFRGGAHGLTTKKYLNINRATKKLLTLRDVFSQDSKEKLTELLVRQAMANEKVASAQALSCQPVPTENFALMSDGVLFYYNPYDIAPYARGAIEIKLPYRKIAPLLAR